MSATFTTYTHTAAAKDFPINRPLDSDGQAGAGWIVKTSGRKIAYIKLEKHADGGGHSWFVSYLDQAHNLNNRTRTARDFEMVDASREDVINEIAYELGLGAFADHVKYLRYDAYCDAVNNAFATATDDEYRGDIYARAVANYRASRGWN